MIFGDDFQSSSGSMIVAGCEPSMSRGASSGGQPDQPGAAVVVSNIRGNLQAVATRAAAENGEAKHRQYITKPPGFIVAGRLVTVETGFYYRQWPMDKRQWQHAVAVNPQGARN